MPTIVQKSVFGVPVALQGTGNIGFYEINRKYLFPTLTATKGFTVVDEIDMGSASMQSNSIITLPNGAPYDVNQTYDAPHVMRDIPVNFKIITPSIIDEGAELPSVQVNILKSGIGERVTLYVANNIDSSNMYKILTRVKNVNAVFSQAGITAVSILLAPVETEWTFTTSFS